MKWNLRMVAAQRDLWRPVEVLAAFRQVGFDPSLSKVAALWSGTPVTVRLDDLDKMCAALNCTVADLLQAEPLPAGQAVPETGQRAVGAEEGPGTGPVRPVPRSRRSAGPRWLPPS
ncbi:helix-turn-helix domain-containing protein [Streptomyces lavendulae]|uniref:helix-turn-helix domain-containing protein n=1 Tax=Streptomyces lavendulae TaxID=1914 RepID=UPI0033D36F63